MRQSIIDDLAELRLKITQSLQDQGFLIRDRKIILPEGLCKEKIRKLHEAAVSHKIEQARKSLQRVEDKLLGRIASGYEVNPLRMKPRLVEVKSQSEEGLLFRYASLHWRIPVSSGYGRRLRFLVVDEQNEKLIGLIGLGDPVFSLGPRDQWIGWTPSQRRERLRHVMDAFVLGAVPPYSYLLCGKLVAMLAASDTVRRAFKRKYGGVTSVIQDKEHDGRLALITTTSALGRSSLYNRLRFKDRLLYRSVGFTRGSGEFHFSNGLYGTINEFVKAHCEPTAKQERWGTGFRNRREVIRKCLRVLGLSSELMYHGIKREVFVAPLAQNTREFLRGEHNHLMWYQLSEAELFEYFQERWLLPRAGRDQRYRTFEAESYRLWRAP